MKVRFWFDPYCPFCWVTSRWILRVAPERDLDIEWMPISLFFKNEPGPDDDRFEEFRRTRDLLRVAQSLREADHDDRVGGLYTELGRCIHHHDQFEFDLEVVLEGLDVDPAHARAVDDERFDAGICASMHEILQLTGEDVGTPLLAVPSADGEVGFFGPVLTRLPDEEEGLRLWDGFVAMAGVPGFYELKRTRDKRPQTPPDHVLP